MNLKDLKEENKIFECVAGSRAYGTNIPGSDVDIRGIFVMPKEHHLSLKPTIKQVSDTTNDITFYELKRYLELASDCNPNLIELLWSPEDCLNKVTPVMQLLIDNRDLFISQKAYHTFTGYAHAQIKRAKGQNKWVNNPQKVDPPTKLDFCWWFDVVSVGELEDERDLSIDEFPMRPIKISDSSIDLSQYNVAKLEHSDNMYRLYNYGEDAKGIFRGKNEQLVTESIPKEDEWPRFAGIFRYDKQAYEKAHDNWKNYWNWMKNRNQERYKSQEAGEIDFDCYLESETEFLTDLGWLKYDDIENKNRLATISPEDNSLEFQNFTDRFSSLYDGVIYSYENSYTRFSVTPNHNLYVSDCRRGPKNGYSTKYSKELSNWYFESVEDYFKGKRSHKHILTCCEINNTEDCDVSDDFIILLGLYLSEGSIAYTRKGVPKYVFISQLEDGKICYLMDKISKYDISVSKHFRKGRNELTYIVKDDNLASQFKKYGCYSQDKKMPFDLVMSFSKRQLDLLIESMIAGDGHRHTKGHSVYYTTSKRLADDLTAILVKNGVPFQLYGPYSYDDENLPMYQVFISRSREGNSTIGMSKMSPRNNGYSGWTQQDVENERIVCFTVPNSILITRNKGKVAFQGNSKNMMHCLRLLWSGGNILRHGEPIVRFEGDKKEFLMKVRKGLLPYEDLMDMVEEEKEKLDALKESSSIPYEVDKEKVDKLYFTMLNKLEE